MVHFSFPLAAGAPGDGVEPCQRIVAIGDAVAVVQGKAGGAARYAGDVVGAGEAGIVEPGDGFGLELQAAVVGKGVGAQGIADLALAVPGPSSLPGAW